jgi:hypothetical protein
MRFDRAPKLRASDPTAGVPRGFWGAVGNGMTLWMLRRAVFVVAAAGLGALVSMAWYGGGAADGALAGAVVGFGLLMVWFALANIIF